MTPLKPSFSFYFLLAATLLLGLLALAGNAPERRLPDVVAKTTALERKQAIVDKRFHVPQNAWVDSVYAALNDTQRLAQLFMVAAFSTTDKPDAKLEALIRNYNLGGLIFMKGTPVRQANLTNHYQSLARTPMLIAMDAEWGLAMRLDSLQRYPYQITLGAIADDKLVYDMGRQLAAQCRAMGVHISFSPVVDVNNNPANPVIGHRSFGSSKYVVANRGARYMQGLQEHGIIACAKHFPGHGDTDADSHEATPVIRGDRKRLDTLELYPFRHLINEGVASVMVAHLSVPAIDPTPKTPTTLSPKAINELLRHDLRFKGLVFTDALNMKGVADLYPPGEVDALALLAGNDILLYSMDVPTAIQRILKAVADKRISWKQLEGRVKKVIGAKYWAGLHSYQPVNTDSLLLRMQPLEMYTLHQRIFEQAVTLVRDDKKQVPLRALPLNTLYVGIGGAQPSRDAFDAYALFHSAEFFQLPIKADAAQLQQLRERIEKADRVVYAWHLPTQKAGLRWGIDTLTLDSLKRYADGKSLTQLIYGNPYSLQLLNFGELVAVGYEEHPAAFRALTNALFGSGRFSGRLPVNINEQLPMGSGLRTSGQFNLRWETPAALGMQPAALRQLDTMLQAAVRMGAMPGGQLIVAHRRNVIYARAVGFQARDSLTPATLATVYDLASVTKITATTAGLMALHQQGRLPIDSSLGFFLPELVGTDKADITLRELLSHQAGLPAYLPFWKNTMKGKQRNPALYRSAHSDSFALQVADSLWLRSDYADSVWYWVKSAPLSGRGNYRYSDLSMHIAWRILQQHLHPQPAAWLDTMYYRRLGAHTLGYRPQQRIPLARIAPTEFDREFRQQQLQGHVHDQTAALLGGIAGHAGLFSTGPDLLRFWIHAAAPGRMSAAPVWPIATLALFTSPQFVGNRRGLGFDKPETERGKASPTAASTPGSSFGHTGFSGTAVWVDPRNELCFIFLSNRIHPDASNTRLLDANVRTRLQEQLYRAWESRLVADPKGQKPTLQETKSLD